MALCSSSKLRPKLIKNGYEYTVLRKNQDNVRWKCSKGNCFGKISTDLHEPYTSFFNLTPHNHDQINDDDMLSSAVYTAKATMKIRANNNEESTNQVLLNTAHKCSVEVCKKLGTTDVLRRTIRRARRKNNTKESKNLLFKFPVKWKNTKGFKTFIIMSKRRAGSDLTRDNWDEEEEKVEAGVFKVADESTLKTRVFKTAKRTIQRDDPDKIKPIFSGFSGFNNLSSNSSSKQAFSFLSKSNETPSESGNHPSASTINSMTTSSSLKNSENNCSKSASPIVVNPIQVMKLNESFIRFVTDAVQKNPYCVLTPTLKDYEKQVSKFVTLMGCNTNTSDSSMTSNKETPQISSFENTVTRIKNSDEVKNNSVNIQTTSTSFVNPNNNNFNKEPLFNFGIKSSVTNANKSSETNLKLIKTDEEIKDEKNPEPKSPLTSSEESKNTQTATSGFKLGDFKFNQQSFSTLLTNKPSSEFVSNDQKISPLSKPLETKFNTTPPFSFGTTSAPTFTFNTEKNGDNKSFFSFGSKQPTVTPISDSSKTTEAQKPEEEDEDQPPVVNFTPIKENDAIFESKSKLYCLKNGKYEEHGIGQLYLKHVDEKNMQLIMRNDNALGTIMVNTLLNKSVNFTKRNAKNVQLICVLDPTKSTKPQTVLFKFKDSQITDSFENELTKLKK